MDTPLKRVRFSPQGVDGFPVSSSRFPVSSTRVGRGGSSPHRMDQLSTNEYNELLRLQINDLAEKLQRSKEELGTTRSALKSAQQKILELQMQFYAKNLDLESQDAALKGRIQQAKIEAHKPSQKPPQKKLIVSIVAGTCIFAAAVVVGVAVAIARWRLV